MSILERPPLQQVGRSVPRRDAHEKLTGAAQFVGDFVVPRMAHGKVLRSPFAHARVLAVDASEAESLPGVRAAPATAGGKAGQQRKAEQRLAGPPMPVSQPYADRPHRLQS
jgi:CO/xanthine dehydrogenase Mo-binding subunit